ncbi:MAG: hypothetical protein HIU82_05765 [Proteobacteria bacterium]|nr:hypothetical protein [Pseudomonadota bacterium]
MKMSVRNPVIAGVAALAAAGLAIPAVAAPPGCAPPAARPVATTAGNPMPVGPEVLVALPMGTVVTLPGQAEQLTVVPVAAALPPPVRPELRSIVDMQAMMHRMMVRMTALLDAPWGPPSGLIRAAFGPHPWTGAGPGTRMMVTTVSTGQGNGQGACSETVSYRYPAAGGKPIVTVSREGNACGAVRLQEPGMTQVALPATSLPAASTAPRDVQALPTGPRLIPARYVVRAGEPPAAPHS